MAELTTTLHLRLRSDIAGKANRDRRSLKHLGCFEHLGRSGQRSFRRIEQSARHQRPQASRHGRQAALSTTSKIATGLGAGFDCQPSLAKRCARRINKGFLRHPQPRQSPAPQRNLNRLCPRGGAWTLTQPRAATQPAAGVLPVLGELTLGAASGKEHKHALLGILPQGRAWQGKNLRTRVLGAWAKEFARIDASMSGLLRESSPATAKEMLPEWERLLSITPAKRATLAQRR